MTTLQIKYCDIPAYLHAGEFYRSLNSDDPEETFEVPADCFHQDGKTTATVEEFRQLLRVMEFWMLDEIPLGILHFCHKHSVEEWEQSIAELPGALRQTVQPLLLSVCTKSEYDIFKEIVKTGRWELIMYAVSRIDDQASVMLVAAQCGDLTLLQHLHENEYEWDEGTCAAASREGHLDCLQFAHENSCPWDVEVYKEAAQNGHLNCMQYAHRQGLREWHKDVCKEAALGGHLDCLQFAHENGCPWDSDTTTRTAGEGHPDCLRYALEHGCPPDERAYSAACRGGDVECLQLLHQFGVPCDYNMTNYAAQCPGIDCLQYLHEHGCPWNGNTPNAAARAGHIEPLRYALENGCPYFDFIVCCAAYGNNLDCLQYIVENQGLLMNEGVSKLALLKGDLANLQYLLDQGCPFLDVKFDDDEVEFDYYQYAFRKDNPEFVLCVEFAVERGWVPCSNFIKFIVTRDQPCRDWLIKEGFYAE